MVSAHCNALWGPTDEQKWHIGRRRDFKHPDYGHFINAFEIVNSNGLCLDVAYASGSGNIGVYHCGDANDQYFWFKNRGKALYSGLLINKK